MCSYCNVTDGGIHHPDCPNDREFNNEVIERGRRGEEPTKKHDGFFWVYGTDEWVTTRRGQPRNE